MNTCIHIQEEDKKDVDVLTISRVFDNHSLPPPPPSPYAALPPTPPSTTATTPYTWLQQPPPMRPARPSVATTTATDNALAPQPPTTHATYNGSNSAARAVLETLSSSGKHCQRGG